MAIFYNQANLSYRGFITTSNVTVGEIRSTLSITKTAVVASYAPGGTVTYAISLTNGGAALTGINVTDNLGAYTLEALTLVPLDYVPGSVRYYVNGVLTTPPTVNPGPPLSFEGLSIPAGANVLILYEAVTNSFAPREAGSTITNTATVTSCTTGEGDTATETVTVLAEADLAITKSLCPATVICGEELTYTFVIQNSGNTAVVATDDMIITDTFSPAFTTITATFNGTTLVRDTDYTYNELTGEFATLPGALTVPAATFARAEDGSVTVTPGVSVLTVSGTI